MKYICLIFSLLLTASVPAQSPPTGFFLTPAEIQQLPASGRAWDYLKQKAAESYSGPDLSDQDDEVNVRVLAGTLVSVRTGDTALRDKVRTAVLASINTENGGRTLALGRELMAYVIAADLCGFASAADEQRYKTWLSAVRRETLDGKTLISTHEVRPNNWGTAAGASRIAAARYLGDSTDLARAAKVFRGWLGDRAAYAGFDYGDLSWQADPSKPVGINPANSFKQGHSIDGVVPDDQRRGGSFTWPPPCENYTWTGLEGALLQAWLLSRVPEYRDVWTWSNSALARAYAWLHFSGDNKKACPATGNDLWQTALVNYVYDTTWPTSSPAPLSRMVIGADWWGQIVGTVPNPEPTITVPYTFTPSNGIWTCTTNGTVPGTGSTKNAALRDWCARNPASP